MRQGTFTPLKALYIQSIFQMFHYTPRGLMDKAVVSGLIGQEFKSWCRQDFFFLYHYKLAISGLFLLYLFSQLKLLKNLVFICCMIII